MFTGLIEETGTISEIKNTGSSLFLTIQAKKVLENLKIGDSVSVNGACQTVTEISDKEFCVFASKETVSVTNFGEYKAGDAVNLERPLRLADRLDGHIVSGHVDTVAVVKSVTKVAQAYEFEFEADAKYFKQIVKKGSVAIDGISLTVADIQNNVFKVAVIPHTFESTVLKYLKAGDKVNLETDLIAKYVENYLYSNDNNSNITMDLLERNGFL